MMKDLPNKILKIIEAHPNIGSENIYQRLIDEDPNFSMSYRSIQHHLTNLKRKGLVFSYMSSGRQIIYSPTKETLQTMSQFYAEFWTQIFQTYNQMFDRAVSFDWVILKLQGLVKLLPPKLRTQINLNIKLCKNEIKNIHTIENAFEQLSTIIHNEFSDSSVTSSDIKGEENKP
jgi:predicted transcriptional regulator